MKRLLLSALLVFPAVRLAADASPDVKAEVDKGVAAYNAKDLAHYQAALAADAVYIAEDGAVIVGKDGVIGLFTRIFAATPPRQLAISELATGARGEMAWARFKWTLTIGAEVRKGVATTLFDRSGERWQVVQIQNTPDLHAMPAAHHHH